jgi:hypothetical protein
LAPYLDGDFGRFPPVRLLRVEGGQYPYWVIDGWKRCAAAHWLGLGAISAIVEDV